MLALLALLACSEDPVDTGTPPDPDDLGDTGALSLPELSEAEIETLVGEAILLSLDVGPQAAWAGLEPAVERGEEGCPDFYLGDAPSGLATSDGGWALEDECTTADGVKYDGAAWWLVTAGRGGDDANYAINVERAVVSDLRVAAGGDSLYALSGSWTDTLDITITGSKRAFDYSTNLDLSASGSDAFTPDGAVPGGWRAVGLTTTRSAEGLDEIELELSVYFFDPVLGGQIDAISEQLRWSVVTDGGTGGGSGGSGGCPVEPYGWVSVRTVDGTWIDVPFLNEGTGSTDEEEPAEEDELCDGCATWYVRGIAQGQICPQISSIWDGRVAPPEVEDMMFVPRLESEP